MNKNVQMYSFWNVVSNVLVMVQFLALWSLVLFDILKSVPFYQSGYFTLDISVSLVADGVVEVLWLFEDWVEWE